ncbi:hypothetical protein KX729_06090 [Rhizobium sp. XQZ8]|uniref:hypothetical protein n=1 Tax=Rhizobium populisoli TaxID=2859785 RepID=UPI001CA502F2|nr:hypothetical protein [Rhizobium populisoli]MBW6421007.1 hypothetical protein [Rhizobium populisoli]
MIANNLMATETFILKFLSPETGCSAHELKFEAEVEAIARLLVVDVDDLTGAIYYLDSNERMAIGQLLGLPLPNWDGDVQIDRPHWIDRVPYLVHTGFELPLMLDGRKPLSVFCDEKDWLLERLSCFRPHVEDCRIIGITQERADKSDGLIEVFFALPGEEWRIEAYIELERMPGPWNNDKEHRQGLLLGYTEQQCDWWIANRKRPIIAPELPATQLPA